MEAVKQKWEYLKVIIEVQPGHISEGITGKKFDETLERLGEQGWEMATATPMNTYMGTVSVTLFFKRPS